MSSELFIELGMEELPARFVVPAMEGLAAAVDRLLASIPHGAIRTFGTPRRIAVAVADVAAARPTVERVVTGPPVAAAFRDGQPTPAADAFAKARGVPVAELLRVDTPKGPVIAARKLEGGEPTTQVVAAGLEEAVLSIPFKKSMRWGAGAARFGRPLHHVCAVYGGETIETTVAGVFTTNTSSGHWLWGKEPFAVTDAAQWLAGLRARWVLADLAERRADMVRQLAEAAVTQGCEPRFDEELVDEVVNLVELPTVIVGRFDPTLLELPPRLLVESMKKNQRYFPLYRAGSLTHEFLVVSNNPHGDVALIAEGNARVLAARFHDARFFYAEDRRKRLVEHGAKLAGMVWIRGLGTMAERQQALAVAAQGLAGALGADTTAAFGAGELCKCDLPTQMVGEFPELQGHVGRLLAEGEGIDAAVAIAIEEHYLPRFAGDDLPRTGAGRALALADRLTLLARAFSFGLAPKGSADPQGLRRAANGVVQILLDAGLRIDVGALFAAAGTPASADLVEFVLARLRATLQGEGHATDLVDAVMATGGADVVHIAERVRAMSRMAKEGAFDPVRATFRRVAGLAKDHDGVDYDAALFQHDAEHALHAAFARLSPAEDAGQLLAELVQLRPVVDAFFDAVLVMCDDVAVRDNRLGLLRAIQAHFGQLADFSRLSSD